MRKLHIYLSLSLLLISSFSLAQINFLQDEDFSVNLPSKSLIAVGIADVNGDRRDDIIRVKDGEELQVIYIADHLGKFISTTENIELDEAWSMVVANVDNDIRNEILVSRAFKDLQIVKAQSDNSLALHQTIENTRYTQSSSMADINNDGWLDIFVCSDDSESTILRNDGAGNFVKDESLIDLATKASSDGSGNYGSEWTDIDSDGDLDLYISKCKAGVTNPNDPRRINMLFINNGQNQYIEMARDFKLNFGQQSWASSFGDFDNDGDMDGIVVHHEAHHSLLENVDNQFVDRSNQIDDLESYAFQVITRDFDNNGFLDILLTGDADYMLWNQGNFKFETVKNPFTHYQMISLATGDINRDGFLDVLGVYGGNSLNSPGHLNDVLWMNEGNTNHAVSFSLRGVESNKNGVGARISIFGPWGVQMRDVKAGESYSISNSLNVHFGIGSHTVIDKVEVMWPSGQLDVHSIVPADKFYQLTEGSCIIPVKSSEDSSQQLCQGEEIRLKSTLPVSWSDGTLADEMLVKNEGIYFYESDQFGCTVTSPSFFVDMIDDDENVSLLQNTVMACNDEAFHISYVNANGDEEILEIDEDIEGEKQITIPGMCYDGSRTVFFKRAYVPIPEKTSDTVKEGTTKSYTNNGLKWNWYLQDDSAVPFFRGDTIEIPNIEESRLYYIETEQRLEYPSHSGGEYNFTGTNQYSSSRIYGGMYFNVKQESVLEELSVYTDTEGEREIQILNALDELVFSQRVQLTTGRNRLSLHAELPIGNDYFIQTNIEVNAAELGQDSPQLVRSDSGTNYPYQIGDLMTIINSSFGPGYYLYFYDWQVSQPDFICTSDRVAFSIIVEESTAVEDEFSDVRVNIFPNPAIDKLNFDFPDELNLNLVKLVNLQGKVLKQTSGQMYLDLSSIAAGLYVVELHFEDQIVKKQIVIAK